MIRALKLLALAAVAVPAASAMAQAPTHVGVAGCGPCHKTEKSGNQIGAWEKTQHAKAFTTLTTAKAAEVAKAKGITAVPSEAKECLECHTIPGAATAATSKFDAKQGVQCENCHGPGSAYKANAVMKDHAKSVAAGMTEYTDKAAIEVQCKTCHNDKSPTAKAFNFEEQWAKIAHPTPKAP
jgi:excinuclease UvrABC ATPase subunit